MTIYQLYNFIHVSSVCSVTQMTDLNLPCHLSEVLHDLQYQDDQYEVHFL